MPDADARSAIENLIHACSYARDARLPEEAANLSTGDADVSFFLNGAVTPAFKMTGREKLLAGM